MKISPLAGKTAPLSLLVNVPQLIASYYSEIPNPEVRAQRVSFGTSGHRGSSLDTSFNEWHILAICQAICEYRYEQGINGPLYLGMDTHALSPPAQSSAIEVLAANGVNIFWAGVNAYTPTPAVSHAILAYNKEKKAHFADGIVITPSHNPPNDGGIKYNPPNGGPADQTVTSWIEKRANEHLKQKLQNVKRLPYEKALTASTTHRFDFMQAYVNDLESVIDMKVISDSRIQLGVDPLGGAGVYYWDAIKLKYKLNLEIVSRDVDPTFSFMSVDWDGQIRMDPSSSYAMQRLIGLKERFQIAFACDTDHDRHGIVTKSSGLLSTNQYLTCALNYLFTNRPKWQQRAMIGKTVVTSQMIDRAARMLGRKVYEVPVGFKWFVDGLMDGSLAFVGEESAGATFTRFDGSVWTTDKDGIIPCLLAAEMTAKSGRDPGEQYIELTKELGNPSYERVDAKATVEQKERLKNLTKEQITLSSLAGEPIRAILTHAPGNNAPIGGIKVESDNGWFAARPSGTEEIYKIYAESFLGPEHLSRIIQDAQSIVDEALQAVKR